MAKRFDLLLDNNDIVVSNNDVSFNDSDDQHVIDTINGFAGWWKESFTEGVGIFTFMKGRNVQQELAKKIKLNLLADGYDSSPIVGYDSSQKLTVDPNVSI